MCGHRVGKKVADKTSWKYQPMHSTSDSVVGGQRYLYRW